MYQPEKDVLEENLQAKTEYDSLINLEEHKRVEQHLHEAQKLREEIERLLQVERKRSASVERLLRNERARSTGEIAVLKKKHWNPKRNQKVNSKTKMIS